MIRTVDRSSTSSSKDSANVKVKTSRRRRREQGPDSKTVIKPLLHTVNYKNSDEIALAIFRDITNTLACDRESEEYVQKIRRELFVLCNFNRTLIKEERRFPYLLSLKDVLARYLELEYVVLYTKTDPNNWSAREGEVEKRARSLLYMMLCNTEQPPIDHKFLHKSVLHVLQQVDRQYIVEGRFIQKLNIHVLQKYGKFDSVLKIKDSREDFLIEHLRNNDPDIVYLSIDPFEDVKHYESNVFLKVSEINEDDIACSIDLSTYSKVDCKLEKVESIEEKYFDKDLKQCGLVLTIDLTSEVEEDEDKNSRPCSTKTQFISDRCCKSDLTDKDLPNPSVQTVAVESTNVSELSASCRSNSPCDDDVIIIINDGDNSSNYSENEGGSVPNEEANIVDLISDDEQEAQEEKEEENQYVHDSVTNDTSRDSGPECPIPVNQVNEISNNEQPLNSSQSCSAPINQVNEISDNNSNELAPAIHPNPVSIRVRSVTINQVNEVSSSVISESDEISRNEEVPANDGNVSSTGNSPSRNLVPYFNGEISSTTGKLDEIALIELIYQKQSYFADYNFENSPSQSSTAYNKTFEAEKDCGISSPTDEIAENGTESVRVQNDDEPEQYEEEHNEPVINISEEDSRRKEESTNEPCSSKVKTQDQNCSQTVSVLQNEEETVTVSECSEETVEIEEGINQSAPVQVTENERTVEHELELLASTGSGGAMVNVKSDNSLVLLEGEHDDFSLTLSLPTVQERAEELSTFMVEEQQLSYHNQASSEELDENTNLLNIDSSLIPVSEPLEHDSNAVMEEIECSHRDEASSDEVDKNTDFLNHDNSLISESVPRTIISERKESGRTEKIECLDLVTEVVNFNADEVINHPQKNEDVNRFDDATEDVCIILEALINISTDSFIVKGRNTESYSVLKEALSNDSHLDKPSGLELRADSHEAQLSDTFTNECIELISSVEDCEKQISNNSIESTEIVQSEMPLKELNDSWLPESSTYQGIIETNVETGNNDLESGISLTKDTEPNENAVDNDQVPNCNLQLGNSPTNNCTLFDEPISQKQVLNANERTDSEEKLDDQTEILAEIEKILTEPIAEQLLKTSAKELDILCNDNRIELGDSPSEDPKPDECEFISQEKQFTSDVETVSESTVKPICNTNSIDILELRPSLVEDVGVEFDLPEKQTADDVNQEKMDSEDLSKPLKDKDQCITNNNNEGIIDDIKSNDEKTACDFPRRNSHRKKIKSRGSHRKNIAKSDLSLSGRKKQFEDSLPENLLGLNETNEKPQCENDLGAINFESSDPSLTECAHHQATLNDLESINNNNKGTNNDTKTACDFPRRDSQRKKIKSGGSRRKNIIKLDDVSLGRGEKQFEDSFSENLIEHNEINEKSQCDENDLSAINFESSDPSLTECAHHQATLNDFEPTNNNKVTNNDEKTACGFLRRDSQRKKIKSGDSRRKSVVKSDDLFLGRRKKQFEDSSENLNEHNEINEKSQCDENDLSAINFECSDPSLTECAHHQATLNNLEPRYLQTDSLESEELPKNNFELVTNTFQCGNSQIENNKNESYPESLPENNLHDIVTENALNEVDSNLNCFTYNIDIDVAPVEVMVNNDEEQGEVSTEENEFIETNEETDNGKAHLDSSVYNNRNFATEINEACLVNNIEEPPVLTSLDSSIFTNKNFATETNDEVSDAQRNLDSSASINRNFSVEANEVTDVINNSEEMNDDTEKLPLKSLETSSVSTNVNFSVETNEAADVIDNTEELPIITVQASLDSSVSTDENFAVETNEITDVIISTDKSPSEVVQASLDSFVYASRNVVAEMDDRTTDVMNNDEKLPIETMQACLDLSVSTNRMETNENTDVIDNAEKLLIETAQASSIPVTIERNDTEKLPDEIGLNSSVSVVNDFAVESNENVSKELSIPSVLVSLDSYVSMAAETNENVGIIHNEQINLASSASANNNFVTEANESADIINKAKKLPDEVSFDATKQLSIPNVLLSLDSSISVAAETNENVVIIDKEPSASVNINFVTEGNESVDIINRVEKLPDEVSLDANKELLIPSVLLSSDSSVSMTAERNENVGIIDNTQINLASSASANSNFVNQANVSADIINKAEKLPDEVSLDANKELSISNVLLSLDSSISVAAETNENVVIIDKEPSASVNINFVTEGNESVDVINRVEKLPDEVSLDTNKELLIPSVLVSSDSSISMTVETNENVGIIDNAQINLASSASANSNFVTEANESADIINKAEKLPDEVSFDATKELSIPNVLLSLDSSISVGAETNENVVIIDKEPSASVNINFVTEGNESADVINRVGKLPDEVSLDANKKLLIPSVLLSLDSSVSMAAEINENVGIIDNEQINLASSASANSNFVNEANESADVINKAEKLPDKVSLDLPVPTDRNFAVEKNENADVINDTETLMIPGVRSLDLSASTNGNLSAETNEHTDMTNSNEKLSSEIVQATLDPSISIDTDCVMEINESADITASNNEKLPIKIVQTNFDPLPKHNNFPMQLEVEVPELFSNDEKQAANALECYKNSKNFFALSVVEQHNYKTDNFVFAPDEQVSEIPKKKNLENVQPELSVLIYNPDVNKNPLNLLATAAGTLPNLEVSPSKKLERSRVKMGGTKPCNKGKRQRSPKAASNIKTRTTPPRAAKNNVLLNYCDKSKRFSIKTWIERNTRLSKANKIMAENISQQQKPPESTYNTNFNPVNDESSDSFDGLIIAEDVDIPESESQTKLDILDENTVDNELVMVQSQPESAIQISIPETEDYDHQILDDLEKIEEHKEHVACKNLFGYDPAFPVNNLPKTNDRENAPKKTKTTDHSIQSILNIPPMKSTLDFTLYTQNDSALDLSLGKCLPYEKSKSSLTSYMFSDDGEILSPKCIKNQTEHNESGGRIQTKTKAEVKEYPFVCLSRQEVSDYISSQSVLPDQESLSESSEKLSMTRKRILRSTSVKYKTLKSRKRTTEERKRNRKRKRAKKTKLLNLEGILLNDENTTVIKAETLINLLDEKIAKSAKEKELKPSKKERKNNFNIQNKSENINENVTIETDKRGKRNDKIDRIKKTKGNTKEENHEDSEQEKDPLTSENEIEIPLIKLKKNINKNLEEHNSMVDQENDHLTSINEPEKSKKNDIVKNIRSTERRRTMETKGSEQNEVEVKPKKNEAIKNTRCTERQRSVESKRSEQENQLEKAETKHKKNENEKQDVVVDRGCEPGKDGIAVEISVVKSKRNEQRKSTENKKNEQENERETAEVKPKKTEIVKREKDKKIECVNEQEETIKKTRRIEKQRIIENKKEEQGSEQEKAELTSANEKDEIEVKLKKNDSIKKTRQIEKQKIAESKRNEYENEPGMVEMKLRKHEILKFEKCKKSNEREPERDEIKTQNEPEIFDTKPKKYEIIKSARNIDKCGLEVKSKENELIKSKRHKKLDTKESDEITSSKGTEKLKARSEVTRSIKNHKRNEQQRNTFTSVNELDNKNEIVKNTERLTPPENQQEKDEAPSKHEITKLEITSKKNDPEKKIEIIENVDRLLIVESKEKVQESEEKPNQNETVVNIEKQDLVDNKRNEQDTEICKSLENRIDDQISVVEIKKSETKSRENLKISADKDEEVKQKETKMEDANFISAVQVALVENEKKTKKSKRCKDEKKVNSDKIHKKLSVKNVEVVMNESGDSQNEKIPEKISEIASESRPLQDKHREEIKIEEDEKIMCEKDTYVFMEQNNDVKNETMTGNEILNSEENKKILNLMKDNSSSVTSDLKTKGAEIIENIKNKEGFFDLAEPEKMLGIKDEENENIQNSKREDDGAVLMKQNEELSSMKVIGDEGDSDVNLADVDKDNGRDLRSTKRNCNENVDGLQKSEIVIYTENVEISEPFILCPEKEISLNKTVPPNEIVPNSETVTLPKNKRKLAAESRKEKEPINTEKKESLKSEKGFSENKRVLPEKIIANNELSADLTKEEKPINTEIVTLKPEKEISKNNGTSPNEIITKNETVISKNKGKFRAELTKEEKPINTENADTFALDSEKEVSKNETASPNETETLSKSKRKLSKQTKEENSMKTENTETVSLKVEKEICKNKRASPKEVVANSEIVTLSKNKRKLPAESTNPIKTENTEPVSLKSEKDMFENERASPNEIIANSELVTSKSKLKSPGESTKEEKTIQTENIETVSLESEKEISKSKRASSSEIVVNCEIVTSKNKLKLPAKLRKPIKTENSETVSLESGKEVFKNKRASSNEIIAYGETVTLSKNKLKLPGELTKEEKSIKTVNTETVSLESEKEIFENKRTSLNEIVANSEIETSKNKRKLLAESTKPSKTENEETVCLESEKEIYENKTTSSDEMVASSEIMTSSKNKRKLPAELKKPIKTENTETVSLESEKENFKNKRASSNEVVANSEIETLSKNKLKSLAELTKEEKTIETENIETGSLECEKDISENKRASPIDIIANREVVLLPKKKRKLPAELTKEEKSIKTENPENVSLVSEKEIFKNKRDSSNEIVPICEIVTSKDELKLAAESTKQIKTESTDTVSLESEKEIYENKRANEIVVNSETVTSKNKRKLPTESAKQEKTIETENIETISLESEKESFKNKRASTNQIVANREIVSLFKKKRKSPAESTKEEKPIKTESPEFVPLESEKDIFKNKRASSNEIVANSEIVSSSKNKQNFPTELTKQKQEEPIKTESTETVFNEIVPNSEIVISKNKFKLSTESTKEKPIKTGSSETVSLESEKDIFKNNRGSSNEIVANSEIVKSKNKLKFPAKLTKPIKTESTETVSLEPQKEIYEDKIVVNSEKVTLINKRKLLVESTKEEKPIKTEYSETVSLESEKDIFKNNRASSNEIVANSEIVKSKNKLKFPAKLTKPIKTESTETVSLEPQKEIYEDKRASPNEIVVNSEKVTLINKRKLLVESTKEEKPIKTEYSENVSLESEKQICKSTRTSPNVFVVNSEIVLSKNKLKLPEKPTKPIKIENKETIFLESEKEICKIKRASPNEIVANSEIVTLSKNKRKLPAESTKPIKTENAESTKPIKTENAETVSLESEKETCKNKRASLGEIVANSEIVTSSKNKLKLPEESSKPIKTENIKTVSLELEKEILENKKALPNEIIANNEIVTKLKSPIEFTKEENTIETVNTETVSLEQEKQTFQNKTVSSNEIITNNEIVTLSNNNQKLPSEDDLIKSLETEKDISKNKTSQTNEIVAESTKEEKLINTENTETSTLEPEKEISKNKVSPEDIIANNKTVALLENKQKLPVKSTRKEEKIQIKNTETFTLEPEEIIANNKTVALLKNKQKLPVKSTRKKEKTEIKNTQTFTLEPEEIIVNNKTVVLSKNKQKLPVKSTRKEEKTEIQNTETFTLEPEEIIVNNKTVALSKNKQKLPVKPTRKEDKIEIKNTETFTLKSEKEISKNETAPPNQIITNSETVPELTKEENSMITENTETFTLELEKEISKNKQSLPNQIIASSTTEVLLKNKRKLLVEPTTEYPKKSKLSFQKLKQSLGDKLKTETEKKDVKKTGPKYTKHKFHKIEDIVSNLKSKETHKNETQKPSLVVSHATAVVEQTEPNNALTSDVKHHESLSTHPFESAVTVPVDQMDTDITVSRKLLLDRLINSVEEENENEIIPPVSADVKQTDSEVMNSFSDEPAINSATKEGDGDDSNIKCFNRRSPHHSAVDDAESFSELPVDDAVVNLDANKMETSTKERDLLNHVDVFSSAVTINNGNHDVTLVEQRNDVTVSSEPQVRSSHSSMELQVDDAVMYSDNDLPIDGGPALDNGDLSHEPPLNDETTIAIPIDMTPRTKSFYEPLLDGAASVSVYPLQPQITDTMEDPVKNGRDFSIEDTSETAGNTTEQKMEVCSLPVEELQIADGVFQTKDMTEIADKTAEGKRKIYSQTEKQTTGELKENERNADGEPENVTRVESLPMTVRPTKLKMIATTSNETLDVEVCYKELRDVLLNNSHKTTNPSKSVSQDNIQKITIGDDKLQEQKVKEPALPQTALACNVLDCEEKSIPFTLPPSNTASKENTPLSIKKQKDSAFSLYTQEEINDNSIVNPPSLYVAAKRFNCKINSTIVTSNTKKVTSIYTQEEINDCPAQLKRDPLNPLGNKKILLPLPNVNSLLESAKACSGEEEFVGTSSKQSSGFAYSDNFMSSHFLSHNMLHTDPIPMWRLDEVISENVDILTTNSSAMCDKQLKNAVEFDDDLQEDSRNSSEHLESTSAEDFWSDQEKQNCSEKAVQSSRSHLQAAFNNPIQGENVSRNGIDVDDIRSRKALNSSGTIHIILEPSEHNYCIGGPLLNAKPENNALKQVNTSDLSKMKNNEQVSDNSPVDGEHIFHFSEQISSLVKNNLSTLSMEDSPVDENNDDQDEEKILSLIENSNTFNFSQPTVMSVEKMNDVMMAIANLNNLTSVQNKKPDKQKVDFLFQQEDSISSTDSSVSNDIHSDCDFAVNSIAMLRTQNTDTVDTNDTMDDSDFSPHTSDDFSPPSCSSMEIPTTNVIVKHNQSDFASIDSIFSGNDFDIIAQNKTMQENNAQSQPNSTNELVKQHPDVKFISKNDTSKPDAKLTTIQSNILDDLVKAVQRKNTRTKVLAAQKKTHKEKHDVISQTNNINEIVKQCQNKIKTPSPNHNPPILTPKQDNSSETPSKSSPNKFTQDEDDDKPPVLTPEINFEKFKLQEDSPGKAHQVSSEMKIAKMKNKDDMIPQDHLEDMIDSIKRRQRRRPEKYVDSVLLKVEKETQEEKFKVFEKNKIKSAAISAKQVKDKKSRKRTAEDESSNDSSMSVKVKTKLIDYSDYDETTSSEDLHKNKRDTLKKLKTSELSDSSTSDNDLEIKIRKERRMTSEERDALFYKVRDSKDNEDKNEQQKKIVKEAGVQKQVRFNLQNVKPSTETNNSSKRERQQQYKNAHALSLTPRGHYPQSYNHSREHSHPDYRDRYMRVPIAGSQSSRYPSYPSQSSDRSRSRSPLIKFGNSSERRSGFQDYRMYANSRSVPYSNRPHARRRNVDLPTLLSHYSQIHRSNNSSVEWCENVSGIGTPIPNVSFQAPRPSTSGDSSKRT